MVASITKNATPSGSDGSYPPQNSLEAALSSRQRTESMATINLQSQEQSGGQGTCNHDEAEAMRLRGGCFSLEPCGCVWARTIRNPSLQTRTQTDSLACGRFCRCNADCCSTIERFSAVPRIRSLTSNGLLAVIPCTIS